MKAAKKLGQTRTKRCNRHNNKKGADLPIADFPHDKREKDGYSVWCKGCWKAYHDSRKALKAGGKKVVKTTKAAKTAKAVEYFKSAGKGGKKVTKEVN